METIRILYVITDSGVGGSEQILSSILSLVDKNEFHPVKVVVLKKIREVGQTWLSWGIPVISLEMGRFPSLAILSKLEHEIAMSKPHIIHSFLFHSAQACRLARSRFPDVKLISSPRVNYRFLPLWARLIDRTLARYDDVALAESQRTKDFLVSSEGYRPDKVHLVQNGVDLKKYQFDEQARQLWRTRWGINETDILIGAIGRLHPQKGFDNLIRSIHTLSSSVTGVKWVIIGEGSQESVLKKQSRRFGLNVLFPGKISPLNEIYSALDIYVQSSRYEGLSNALLEAMSSNLPIVATSVDGTLDLARDGQNMVLVPPNDINALSKALNKLIVSPQLRISLGSQARKTVEVHSLQKMVKEVEEVYRTLNPHDSTR